MNNKSKGIIVVIVVFLVLSVWILKNQSEKGLLSNSQTESSPLDSVDGTKEIDTSEFALNVTTELDMEHLKSFGLPIIIDFGADTCIPCKEMAPVLKELNEGLRDKAIIKFVDVWKYQEIGRNFPLQVIPTQFFFDKDGNPYVPSDDIGIRFTMYSTNDNSNEHVYTVHEGGLTKDQMQKILGELGME